MKYIIKLELDNNQFPTDYRRTVISFFKKAISNYLKGEYFDELYENGANHKSLVWSIKFNSPKFSGDIITLGNKHIQLILKIKDPETALIYYTSLLEMMFKPFPLPDGNKMTLKNISMVREKTITENIASFKILSPICLKQHVEYNNKDWYVSIGDQDFVFELQRKLIEDLPNKKNEIEKMLFNFDNLKKIIVLAYQIKFPVTIGSFTVQADSEILNHILKNGIGSKRNSGFGLVELIEN